MKLIISIIILSISFNLKAQVDTLKSPMMKLTLKDSSVYYGRIISSEDNKLTLLKNNNVEIVIPKNEILEIYRVQDLPKEVKKSVSKKDPSEVEENKYVDKGLHRMFFFPTANPVPNSEGYLSSNMIFFPFAAFGIANIFTIGGGVSLIPGATNQIYYFSPKITFLTFKNFTFATGGFITNSLSFSNSNGHAGMVYLIGIIINITTILQQVWLMVMKIIILMILQ